MLSGLCLLAQHFCTVSFGSNMLTDETLRSYAASMCCPFQGRHCHTNDRMLSLFSQLLLAGFPHTRQQTQIWLTLTLLGLQILGVCSENQRPESLRAPGEPAL